MKNYEKEIKEILRKLMTYCYADALQMLIENKPIENKEERVIEILKPFTKQFLSLLDQQREEIRKMVEEMREDILGPKVNKKWLKERGKGYYEGISDILELLNK